ncbi:MAG: hypothetical protein AAGU32_14495 [Bacillota bacterium]
MKALRINDLYPQVMAGRKALDANRALTDLIEAQTAGNAELRAQLAASQQETRATGEDTKHPSL